MKRLTSWRLALALLPLIGATGCASFTCSSPTRHASSAVEFLYPGKTDHIDRPAVPVLSLPLSVGVAFVPEQTNRTHFPRPGVISEARKVQLLAEVSRQFKEYPFIRSIEIIPSAYLRPGGGFANLDQLRSMFGVDVIALVSYDQAQFTDEGLLSLAYWTIVGVYVVQGEKNDTQTMLDTVVYDVASRKLLFRAPGTSAIKRLATPVNLSEELRRDSEAGFEKAAKEMAANLRLQLELFQERVKESPEEFKVVHKPGYKGGGSVGALELAMLLGLGGLTWRRRNQSL